MEKQTDKISSNLSELKLSLATNNCQYSQTFRISFWTKQMVVYRTLIVVYLLMQAR